MKKITGFKKAISEYRRCNSGDPYDSHYGILMFDFESVNYGSMNLLLLIIAHVQTTEVIPLSICHSL